MLEKTELHVTQTSAEATAAEVLRAIGELAAMIPDLQSPHPSTRRRVRAARTVRPEFIASVIAMVEESATLRSVGIFDAEEARANLQFIAAFLPVRDAVAALLDALNYTIEERKAASAEAALRAYAVAKGLHRSPGDMEFAAHMDVMRRDLGVRRIRRAKPAK